MARSDNKVGIAQAAQELSDELSEIESAIDEDADPSYSEDFADGTGTGTLDRSEPRQSVAASPLASPRSRTSEKDASYSEDFAEATLEATLEEALPSAEVQRPALNRRQEIALRQQADAKRTVIVPAVSDEDDIEEEDIPEGGDFSEDDLEASGSMYDPEARRREMEKEAQRQEEEERLRKEQEQAEQARKQREIDEANRRLAAERKRKLEEEEAKRRVEEEAYRKKQEEELRRAEAVRKEEEQRRKTEEEARKREEQRQKAEEEERKKAEEEIRKREEEEEEERKKAAEESRKREEEQRKKVEEEMRKREEEERKQAAEESRKREEEQRAKAEEERRKREEEERKQAAEESRKREEEQRAKAEEERRKREEEEEEERKKAEEEARKRRDEEEERGEAGEAAEIKRRKQEDPGQATAPLDDARSKDRLAASSTSSTSSTSKEGAPASPASKKLCEENCIADGARTAIRDQPAGQARDNSELLKGTVNGFEDSPTRPGLRRFSGAWIQTELDLASAPGDQVYEGGESQASHVGPELSKHLGSPQWDSRDAWSSPKHRQTQWNRDYRSRQRDQTDQTEETDQRWSWEANSGHTDWEEWRHDERNGDESGEWRRKRRNGDWWDWTDSTYSADWAEPRRSEDVRLLFEANGRQGWERFSRQDAATWSQRRSRAMWQEPEEPESPGQRWHGKSRSGQDREGLWSQLEELDRERAHRSPSHASGLWQPPPRARSPSTLGGTVEVWFRSRSVQAELQAWEASHFADLPSGHRPSDRVSAPYQPPGFYGHPTPFGVLYPWGFAGYSVPAPGPWKQPIVDSLTLSPTGSRPAASPNTPGPPPAASDRQLEPRPRAWSGLDNVEQRAPLPSGATTDPLPVEVPPPPGPSALETTLALGSRDLDFQESLVGSLAAVVDEMLQFKYGCSIDTVDYRTKLLGFCDATLCSIQRLVEFANSQKDFFALTAFAGNDPENNREMQMRLRLTCQELASFGDLSQRLRLLAGTASAVVIISTRGGYAVQALAAFRTSCSDARCAVGRCPARGRVLEHFSAEEFCSAVALEPVILSQAPLCSAFASDPPALTEEFRNLQQLLEGRQGSLSRVAKPLSPQLLAALHARAPNALAFRHVAVALASTDVQPEVVGELFRRLVEWFRIKSLSAAQTALAEAPAHVALVACLRRSVERHDLCELGCQLLARAARHHVENAAAFVRAGAPQLVCQILGRHFDFKEVQRYGLQAIAILSHYGGGATQALAADGLRLALQGLRTHRASASVQISGCEVLRCLAELAEAPLEELSEAAQLAKRAFPEDAGVHRAADGLLSFAIPRSAAAIGALMDSAAADETAQRNAICSLGHLAGYGGVAWRGASRVALNRILRAMAQFKGSAVLVASGLWALGRFAERVDAPRGGLQDAAQQAKALHKDSALVCHHADDLIAFLMRPQ